MALLAKPELWRTEVGDAVAVLNIPGALKSARTFDIDVSLLVRVPEDHAEAWHALRIRAVAGTRGAVVQRLLIEAREDL
jgi:hypothetical protein